MGRYISGELKCTIRFKDLYVEDGQSELDALFPDTGGWEGEMWNETWSIEECEDED